MPGFCLTRTCDPFSWTVILLGTIMQQSNVPRFFLLVVLLFGLYQLVGCAAFRRPPERVAVERLTVQEALRQAEEAYEEGAYERARELYDAVVASPEGLPEEQIRAAQDRIVVIDSIFGQRTLVAKRERMAGLLAEAQALVSEERYEEAEAKLASLGIPPELSEEQEADLLNLLVTVERATGRMPGMTEEEVEDRAYRYLEQGMEAYRAKDYATAEGLFKRASALEEHLDYWGRSTLRKSRAEVTATLAELRAAYNEGKRAYRQDDYAGAVHYLQKVVDSGISIGAEQDQDIAWMLGESKVLVAEQRRREEQLRRERLAALFVEARALISEGRYEEAEAMLAELASAAEDLSVRQRRDLQELRVAARLGREREERERIAGLLEEAKALMAQERYEEAEAVVLKAMGVAQELTREQQRELQELRMAVERATGRLPGMTEKEARQLAYAYLERGMKAYHSNDYVAAEGLLGRAVALEEHLDRWGRRTLRSRHAEVTGRLTELRDAYKEGKQLYEQQDYAGAIDLLQWVVDSGLSIGTEQDEEVARLLRESKVGLAEQLEREGQERVARRRQLDERERKERLASLLAEAKALVLQEKHEEAAPKLAELMGAVQELSDEQLDELQELREAVARVTGRLPGMTEEEGEGLAYRYFEAGMAAYRANDYATAEGRFELAALLQEHLDYWDQLTLRSTRAEVTERLTELRGAYSEGKRLYEREDYGRAAELLQTVVDSGISIGAEQDQEVARLLQESKARLVLILRSPAFEPGGMIPARYTEDGQNVSPPLLWRYAPKNTATFALIMEDPDAPVGAFTHWLICEIPSRFQELPEGIIRTEMLETPAGAVQGSNSFLEVGYSGPAPTEGEMHSYYFTLYALDEKLEMSGGFTKNQLRAAMEGHILSEAELVGAYGR